MLPCRWLSRAYPRYSTQAVGIRLVCHQSATYPVATPQESARRVTSSAARHTDQSVTVNYGGVLAGRTEASEQPRSELMSASMTSATPPEMSYGTSRRLNGSNRRHIAAARSFGSRTTCTSLSSSGTLASPFLLSMNTAPKKWCTCWTGPSATSTAPRRRARSSAARPEVHTRPARLMESRST